MVSLNSFGHFIKNSTFNEHNEVVRMIGKKIIWKKKDEKAKNKINFQLKNLLICEEMENYLWEMKSRWSFYNRLNLERMEGENEEKMRRHFEKLHRHYPNHRSKS